MRKLIERLKTDKKMRAAAISTCVGAVIVIAAAIVVPVTLHNRLPVQGGNEVVVTEIEVVTDANGEQVTDAAGEVVTQVFVEVPATNSNGEQVTDTNGQHEISRVPYAVYAELHPEIATTTPASTSRPSSSSDTILSKPTTEPVTEPSATTPTTPTTQPPTQPSIPPATTSPTTAAPTTTKPVTPTTTKPTTTTTQPTTEGTTVRSENIDYFVQYAINYGKSIGMKYRSDLPQEVFGWDYPTTVYDPETGDEVEALERYIRQNLNEKKQYGHNSFYVWTELKSPGKYKLYIGYTSYQ